MVLTMTLTVMNFFSSLPCQAQTNAAEEQSISKAAVEAILDKNITPTAMQLERIERDAFSHAYATDTAEQRICRLEQFVFGKQFSGDLNNRFNKLRKALEPKEIEKAIAPTSASEAALATTQKPKYEFPTFAPKPEEQAPQTQDLKKPISLIDIMNRGIDNYNGHRYHLAEMTSKSAARWRPACRDVSHTWPSPRCN